MNRYNFNNNSLFFKDVLTPADGYEVVFAVGTTYSINMTTLLTVPIMLGAVGDVELSDTNDDASAMAMMHAIMQMKDKICVFVNAGGIHLDKSCNEKGRKLFGLMDTMVKEINLNQSSETTYNFHPKVWIVRERNESGDERIKVVTLSKNLTADPNLDVVCELSGKVLDAEAMVSVGQKSKHQPLIDFLEYLRKKDAGLRQIRELEACIRRVDTFEISDFDSFDDYAFMPILPKPDSPYFGKKCLDQLADKGGSCFVVSPFLGKDVVGEFANGDSKADRILVTRRESLANITELQFERFNEVYVVKESATDEGNEANVSMDIHAKLYLTVQDGRSWLFLGSANATNNAFANNVEFMTGFRIKPHSREYGRFIKTFLGKDSDGNLARTSLFEPVVTLPDKDDVDPPDDSGKIKLREAILALKGAVAKVTEVPESKGMYDIGLYTKRSCGTVAVYPLMAPEQKCRLEGEEMLFTNMPLDSVSAFFVLETANDRPDVNGKEVLVSTVVRLPMEGMPEKSREHYVFRQIVSPDQIYNYLNFVVAEDKQEVIDAMSRQSKHEGETQPAQLYATGGLFEKLMRSSLAMPLSVIDEMSKMLAEFDDRNGLRQMMESYRSVLRKITRIKVEA